MADQINEKFDKDGFRKGLETEVENAEKAISDAADLYETLKRLEAEINKQTTEAVKKADGDKTIVEQIIKVKADVMKKILESRDNYMKIKRFLPLRAEIKEFYVDIPEEGAAPAETAEITDAEIAKNIGVGAAKQIIENNKVLDKARNLRDRCRGFGDVFMWINKQGEVQKVNSSKEAHEALEKTIAVYEEENANLQKRIDSSVSYFINRYTSFFDTWGTVAKNEINLDRKLPTSTDMKKLFNEVNMGFMAILNVLRGNPRAAGASLSHAEGYLVAFRRMETLSRYLYENGTILEGLIDKIDASEEKIQIYEYNLAKAVESNDASKIAKANAALTKEQKVLEGLKIRRKSVMEQNDANIIEFNKQIEKEEEKKKTDAESKPEGKKKNDSDKNS